jgi:hypothetical protein
MQFRAGSMSNTAHIQRLQQRSNHVHRLTLQLGKPWNSLLPYLDAPNEVSKAVAASFDGDAGSGSPANEAGKDALEHLARTTEFLNQALEPIRRLHQSVWQAMAANGGGSGPPRSQQRPGRLLTILRGMAKQAADISPKGPPFRVDLTDPNRPLLITGPTQEVITWELAIFLQMLLDANGRWVTSTCVAQRLGVREFRPARTLENLTNEAVRELIVSKTGAGWRLKAECWQR